MIKIFGTRASVIGDTVMSLPILNVLKRKFPDSYIHFLVDKKCAQSAQLYFNHPLIDKIHISKDIGKLSKTELDLCAECDVVMRVYPHFLSALPQETKEELSSHGEESDIRTLIEKPTVSEELRNKVLNEYIWYNRFDCVQQTMRMAGVDLKYYEELGIESRNPKLYRWWDRKKIGDNHIAIWPIPDYGKGSSNKRSLPVEKWKGVIESLIKSGFHIHHFGWKEELDLSDDTHYHKHVHLTFFEQIQMSLDCNLVIGCDSGSTWVTAAYQEIPQINLLALESRRIHVNNPSAFGPTGLKSYHYMIKKWEHFELDKLISTVKELI